MKILFVEPYESSLFSFRKELLDKLINEGHAVVLCISVTEKINKEYENKIKIIDVPINIKDKGILSNINLINKYRKIIKNEKPELIISYMIKPNIYCGFFANKIPMIANITGLGNMFKSNNVLSKLGIFLYKKSFKNVKYIFFQNSDGLSFFKKHKIPLNNYRIIPGSGVNLQTFTPDKIDRSNSRVNFLFASRPIKEKGFEHLINAIPSVVDFNNNVHFNFLVSREEIDGNEDINFIITKYEKHITFLSRTSQMRKIYLENDFLVSPSFYREGISNVLLESLACARPIITTLDNPGCKEVVQDGINGIGVLSNDLFSLVSALKKASSFSKEEIYSLGLNGRKFVENNFDRSIVIMNYLEIINKLKGK